MDDHRAAWYNKRISGCDRQRPSDRMTSPKDQGYRSFVKEAIISAMDSPASISPPVCSAGSKARQSRRCLPVPQASEKMLILCSLCISGQSLMALDFPDDRQKPDLSPVLISFQVQTSVSLICSCLSASFPIKTPPYFLLV